MIEMTYLLRTWWRN